MIMKQLTIEEISSIYSKNLVFHFPKSEVKPLSNIIKYFNDNCYPCFGFYEEDELIGYAFFVVCSEKYVLLDYLAVLPKFRNRQYGKQILSIIKNQCIHWDGIYIESENPQFARNPEEKQIQDKRIAFYLRNNCNDTGVRSYLYTVNYVILYLPICTNVSTSEHFAHLECIYHHMFSPEKYIKHASISLAKTIIS